MTEVSMNVKLLAHTQFARDFIDDLWRYEGYDKAPDSIDLSDVYDGATDGQGVALTAIRTCYSPISPSQIINEEKEKYFGSPASDGTSGTNADRLFRQIFKSRHLSTLEHLSFTFAIEGVSRALLAQLTRHRVGFSYSVQSQRYVKMGGGDKSGGFDYVLPPCGLDGIETTSKQLHYDKDKNETYWQTLTAQEVFEGAMRDIQGVYDRLRDAGVPAEDARAVLPNAAATNLVMTANLRALLDFYSKRRKGSGAQHEISQLAEALRREVVNVEQWTDQFFEIM